MRMKPIVIGIALKICILLSLSLSLSLSRILGSSLNFRFIDYLVVNVVERASSIYHYGS